MYVNLLDNFVNIHFEDHTMKKYFDDSTLEVFEFGSSLYGLNNTDSDRDFFCVTTHNQNLNLSFLWEHHNYQFKVNDNDYIYNSIQNFIRNLINGDSVPLFEIIHDSACKNSTMSFLYDHREWFYSFTIIRSYLGLARRDLKHSAKDGKKLGHAIRSYYTAYLIFNERKYLNDFRKSNDKEIVDAYALMHNLKNHFDSFSKKEIKELIEHYTEKVVQLRDEVRKSFDKGGLYRVMEVSNMKKLDSWLLDYCHSDYYQNRVFDIDFDLFSENYDILENGVSY